MRRSSAFARSARTTTAALTGALLLTGALFNGTAAAVGEGPDYRGNETINTSILSTYDDVARFLKDQDAKQDAMKLEVIGQTVKGRDIHLVKYVSNPDNPTILYLAQQHGNEQLTTEAMLHTIKSLGSPSKASLLKKVNVLFIPMFNADGAMGDVNFPLDGYLAKGERHLTRYNANEVDLNRDHVAKEQPETQALHENVLRAYDVDYAIDLHHQGTQSRVNGDLVSGSILYPTTPDVSPELVEKSKRLGSVVYHNVDRTGWGHIGRYDGGSANTIGRNGMAAEYGIATLLFEMRGMSDHEYAPYVLGQKSNGYLIRQSVVTMEATIQAVADGSIDQADTSFWDTLPQQCNTC
ncbi:M14 family zinc carboxypeptidase [Streptomyces sp. NBC_00873]|uniref:M14 family zinc carboxypeptidase n=1 Tax=unclassified Streptomyces TaxID=2593676 RepID=UPI0038663B3C|nr:M14 family zinc carboxypeptidase [Streptomyces sp. NBC_00873]WTA41366.1 M14 family zinc carboxypeptidase [Streptomyces sp. NBC_00842]WTE31822.1 M14 family zinc carboxypeptidase [Streptomyces sp. NBC_01618]WSY96861.1 M14 family zinc carboxypeptidase [Streptomyces sp. NBC_00873]WTA48531.1 M14 family zinc carboxypeptidase [Streptomyces sp. NBC_00842]